MQSPRQDPQTTIVSVPLTMLKVGERGLLQSTTLQCDECELLNAMGLTEQCEIRVCKRGSHRKPCIVQVQSTRLGLSAHLASHIYVQRQPA